ncbi:MAG: sulfotransferase [Planctomycetales bacterium]|nr:sulfotransferase [Planctomycetales bacterium]
MSQPGQIAARESTRGTGSPFVMLLVWAAIVVGAAALVQGIAWLAGFEFDILAHGRGGSATLLAISITSLIWLMSRTRRPAAEFGLAIDDRWIGQIGAGFAAGTAFAASWFGILVTAGVVGQRGDIAWWEWFRAAGSGLAVFVVAFCSELIFRGYLLTLFRERHGVVVAAGISSLLFAFANVSGGLRDGVSSAEVQLIVGLFCVGNFLATMRIRSGGILLPASLLAGWLFVATLVRKTRLITGVIDGDSAAWLCPDVDPRQAPVFWLLVIVATVIVATRRGSPVVRSAERQAAFATSFKRVYPFSGMNNFAPLDVWLGRLWQARFAVGWKYVPRLIASLTFSVVSTVVSLPERLILPWLLCKRPIPDPVFILGVHRSGTTHLQNLLALDSQFATPQAYQVLNPVGFLFSGWLFTPLLAVFSPWKRPMDAVRFHIFSPQEEEFALANCCRLSPYWGLTFPRQGDDYDRFIFPEDFSHCELSAWKRHYLLFLRKLTLWNGRRPLLKSPHNTARVGLFREMFPQAKFVHIHRHPFDVYRSNMHTEREGHAVMQVQDTDDASSYATRFLDNYHDMEASCYRHAAELPSHQFCEVSFEELEREPLKVIECIYQQLGLHLTPEFRTRLETYLAGIADYQKNRFRPLPDDVQTTIRQRMQPFIERWGYKTGSVNRRAA